MYLKSLIVFLLCTAFVVAFAVVLNNDASTVNSQLQALPSSETNCSVSDASCPKFVIVSASLRTMNTTDQLGIANPVYLTMRFNVTGSASLTKVQFFVGNVSAGTVQGPFGLGPNEVSNLTLSAAVSASPGKTYRVSAVAFSGSNYVLESVYVTDVLRGPPSA